jgi:hypothetical protein
LFPWSITKHQSQIRVFITDNMAAGQLEKEIT